MAPPFSINGNPVEDSDPVSDADDEFHAKHWLTEQERQLPYQEEADKMAEAMEM